MSDLLDRAIQVPLWGISTRVAPPRASDESLPKAMQANAGMWRIELPDGRLTDMANRTRAKDTALSIACDALNQREGE